jgi:hypothetical protein
MRLPVLHLPTVARWTLLAVAVLCLGALFLLISSTALDKDISFWGRWLLLIVSLGAIGAALITSDFQHKRGGMVRSILDPRNVAILFLAGLLAFSAMTDAVNLFLPRPVVEQTPGQVASDVAKTRAVVEGMAAGARTAPILAKLPGRWGEQEPECGLVWQIDIRGDALIAEIVRRPAGVAPYRLVARITPGTKGNVMDVVGEEPAEARGSAAQFRYSFDGVTERLVWDDQKRASDLQEYRRCA